MALAGMSTKLQQSDLADLASIDLADDFIEANLDRPFNADYARETLNETTELFVKAFLVDQADHVTQLHHSLRECSAVLGDMEQVLLQFVSQLSSIQADIGQVREVLAETSVALANTRASEKVLWAAVSCLVVPPEVVQVITQSNEDELGPQFMLCLRELLKYLNYRKGTWRQAVVGDDAALSPAVRAGHRETDALREVRFSLAECRVYYDLMSVLDALTLYACVKIKTFLSRKLLILTNRNTNVCIQQDHVLKQYGFYVHFLRSAVPLLRNVYSAPPPPPPPPPPLPATSAYAGGSLSASTLSTAASNGMGGGVVDGNAGDGVNGDARSRAGSLGSVVAAPPPTASSGNTTLIPYRIVRALYDEFKQEYCVVVSSIYLQRIQEYALLCNTTEFNTESSTSGTVARSYTSAFGFGAVSTASAGGDSSNSFTGFASGIGSGSADGAPNYTYVLPLITDTRGGGSYMAMRLGERAALLGRVFAPPLIPTLERAGRRKHTYEETIRSLFHLTCDIVTHEYLFTFEFFSGDMSVYVEVFKPTIQFIVDYVSEVVLVNSSGATRQMLNERPHTRVNTLARQDTYGLLLLIRLCHEYRSMMKYTRKLSCLDGLFDSLLMLLWPAFNTCYERQLNALMSARNEHVMLGCMTNMRRTEERLAFVHPVVKSFTEFSCVLMSLCYGATMSEEARSAAAATESSARRPSSGHSLASPDTLTREAGVAESTPASTSTTDAGMNSLPAVGTAAWAAQLRQRALARISEEQESDVADSRSHLTKLMGDVGFMRVELADLLVQLGADIAAAEPDPTRREQLKPLSMAFALNNIFYLLQRSCQYPILFVKDGPASPLGRSPALTGRDGAHVDMGMDGDGPTLEELDDLNGLKELYTRLRGECVQHTVRLHLGHFLRVVQEEDACEPGEVLGIADHFLLHWRMALDGIRATVRQLIADPANAQDITAQACMDVLLYNTRFHAAIARFLEKGTRMAAAGEVNVFHGRSLRSLIVTNQILLQHMRSFSVPIGES